jgi:hypothetical protein
VFDHDVAWLRVAQDLVDHGASGRPRQPIA